MRQRVVLGWQQPRDRVAEHERFSRDRVRFEPLVIERASPPAVWT